MQLLKSSENGQGISRLRRATPVLSAAVLALLPVFHTAYAQPAIPWDNSRTITHVSSQEDLKNVVRTILKANDLKTSFKPGVDGTVSLRLTDVPVQSAFKQVAQEYNLTHEYDPSSRTVVVGSVSSSKKSAREDSVIVPLRHTEFEQLEDVLGDFGLPLSMVNYDPSTRSVAISGSQENVQRVVDAVGALETAMMPVQNVDMLPDAVARREMQAAAPAPVVKATPAEKMEVKVIRLRFADVGPTTKQFQGKTVNIPGIEDTLKSILGLGDKEKAANSGEPRISIDQRTNAVVVQGTPQDVAQVEAMVRELDRPLQMVEIEVVIATADVGVAKQIGLNWRASQLNVGGSPNSLAIDTGVGGTRIANGTGADAFSTNGFDALSLLPSRISPDAILGSFVVRGAEAALQTQLQLLESQDRARILSAPRLVTLDNITARITRSQNIYVQVDTRGDTGSSQGGVGLEQIQTGLTLEITPSIVPADTDRGETLVRLNLRAENSQPGSGVFGQIDVKSQEVQTNVLVPDGATFVIGGLFDDAQITGESGVPGLKEIPVLGSLFKNKSHSKSLGETIFFITPRVVDERTVLEDDIAVKVGSEEYIRRQRRSLSAYHQNVARDSDVLPTSPISTLEEDER